MHLLRVLAVFAATAAAQPSAAPSPAPENPKIKNYILYDIDRAGGKPGKAVVAFGKKKIDFDYSDVGTNRLVLRINGNKDTESIKLIGEGFNSCHNKQSGAFLINADISGGADNRKVFPIPTGKYEVKVKPYTKANCKGTAGDKKELVIKAKYKDSYCLKNAPAVVGYRYLKNNGKFAILKDNSQVCLKEVDILGGGRNIQGMYVDCSKVAAKQVRFFVEKPISTSKRTIGPEGLIADEMLAPIGANPQDGIKVTISANAQALKTKKFGDKTEITFKSIC